jgi:uncharacterized membrane protein YjgN (DUF898 family)
MGIGNQAETAFAFEGNWREFLPIAISNALLNIATLGIYRFWATTRERRYFWSKTRFIDDRFEWTGTGMELFIGFLIALIIFFIPVIGLQLLIQSLILQNKAGLAGLLTAIFYFVVLYLVGLAVFRGLRYRLSRTSWRGIHGGSDNAGFHYGFAYLWKTIAGLLVLGLLVPWSMTSLWKDRWEKMSFGPHQFQSDPQWNVLMKRYLIAYFSPFIALFAAIIIGFTLGLSMFGNPDKSPIMITIAIIGALLAFYIILPLLALIYYSTYMREIIGTLRLVDLEFEFTAYTKDWIKLFLGNLGLWLIAGTIAIVPIIAFNLFDQFSQVQPGENPLTNNPISFLAFIAVVGFTFALVNPFIRYRTWSFYVRHMECGGEVNLTTLTQSSTRNLGQGEGLLDAFDMGAI